MHSSLSSPSFLLVNHHHPTPSSLPSPNLLLPSLHNHQGKPVTQFGHTDDVSTLETPGEVFVLRKLLPATTDYDFNIHVMDFNPGEFLNVKVWCFFESTAGYCGAVCGAFIWCCVQWVCVLHCWLCTHCWMLCTQHVHTNPTPIDHNRKSTTISMACCCSRVREYTA